MSQINTNHTKCLQNEFRPHKYETAALYIESIDNFHTRLSTMLHIPTKTWSALNFPKGKTEWWTCAMQVFRPFSQFWMLCYPKMLRIGKFVRHRERVKAPRRWYRSVLVGPISLGDFWIIKAFRASFFPAKFSNERWNIRFVFERFFTRHCFFLIGAYLISKLFELQIIQQK